MRDRLVGAALSILQREGAAALTVRNITQVAGCSTTGVYTYFGGKHGLVDAIFLDGFESFDRAVGEGFATGDLRASGRAYRAWALAHPTQYMVMFGRAVPDHEPSPEAHARALESFFRLVEAVGTLRRGDVDVDVDADVNVDVAERAYHYWATIHGYVMLEIAGMGAQDRAESEALYERALELLAR
jgi:AcrR family transcriptional regulator